MLAAIFAALLLQQSAPAAEEVFPKGGGERYAKQIRADLRHCHVTPQPFTLTDDFIYDEVVIHPQASDLSEEQVGCLANTPGLDSVTIAFDDQEDEALYRQRFAQRPDVVAAQVEGIRRQRQWLADQGLLAGLPRYDRTQPLSGYIAAIERHCRAEPGSVLVADDEKRTVSGAPNGLTFNDTTQCVFTILLLAMAEGDGADISLTGEDHAP
jgi:hypothetical protein